TFSNDDIVFIVNSANPATTVTFKEINDYFFKRDRDWPDGTSVRFVDQKNSPVRNLFLKTYLHKSAAEVDRFWIGQKLYSGDSAPMQSPSDSLTIQFVGAFNGAI